MQEERELAAVSFLSLRSQGSAWNDFERAAACRPEELTEKSCLSIKSDSALRRASISPRAYGNLEQEQTEGTEWTRMNSPFSLFPPVEPARPHPATITFDLLMLKTRKIH
jgi:hypothetical protein